MVKGGNKSAAPSKLRGPLTRIKSLKPPLYVEAAAGDSLSLSVLIIGRSLVLHTLLRLQRLAATVVSLAFSHSSWENTSLRCRLVY